MKSRSKRVSKPKNPAQDQSQVQPGELKKRTCRRYSRAERDTAASMCLSGMGQEEIAKRLNIPLGTISAWSAQGKWTQAREVAILPIAELARSNAQSRIEKWMQDAEKAVTNQGSLCAQGAPETLKELDQVCRATLANINAAFKLFRLDAQQPQDADSPMRRIRPVQVIDVSSSASPVELPTAETDARLITHNPDGTPK